MRLLWDLDGTIFDTYPAIVDSFLTIYEEVHGEPIHPSEALLWLKRTSLEAFERFEIPESARWKFKELNRERAEEGSEPFEGIEEILAAAELNVIVTHRSKQSTEELLEKWDLLPYFKEIISPDDDGFLRKPDTGAYQYLYDKYDLTWAIGDRALDLIPANTVGMKTCAFQNNEIDADLYIEAYDSTLIEKLK